MRQVIGIAVVVTIIVVLFLLQFFAPSNAEPKKTPLWEFQAIDTMKYSRDLAREKLQDPSYDLLIDRQVADIADTGATHVGIATPYDEEFYPYLKRWVDAARRNNLKVWFRGNFSGWEGWFEYPKITREEHVAKTKAFIENNPELFADGDAFSACPECENGGPGDPRQNGDAAGHREFLIAEYQVTQAAFKAIDRKVGSHYHSMNGDVAKLIMDEATTKALNNTVVVDHYVASPERLAQDIREYGKNGEVDVILGEYGVAIPDIHGDMSQGDQARWLNEALALLSREESLKGLSYWTNTGGSTELWEGESPTEKVAVLKSYYLPVYQKLLIKNAAGDNLDATVTTLNRSFTAGSGVVYLPRLKDQQEISVSYNGYKNTSMALTKDTNSIELTLKKDNENATFRLKKSFFDIFGLN